MQDDNKVVLGRIGAPHGVKGWVKIHAFTQSSEDLFNYGPLLFLNGMQWLPLQLEQKRQQGKVFIAKPKGCDSREQAALLTHSDIAIHASQLPELEADEVYWHQLEGLRVLSLAVGEPVLLGCVDHVLATGANDVLVVTPCVGSLDNSERLIPYIESVVKRCDIELGEILVDWDSEF